MKINSDNAAIEKNLRFLETTIMDHDGWVAPDLTITSTGGEMSIVNNGFHDPTKPLIALPHELLLPSEKLGLRTKGNHMDLDPDNSLSDIQRRLAESMVEIYNLTDKIGLHKQSCCWLTFRENPALLESLLKGRTLNERQQALMDFTAGRDTETDEDDLVCKSYIKTRTIGRKNVQTEGEDEAAPTTDIMPIIDFLNHHPQGSNFHFSPYDPAGGPNEGKIKTLLVKDSRPLPYSNECFAFYNQLDTLDSFINYGFPDRYTTYVRSVPFEIDLPGAGTVKIHAAMGRGVQGKLTKSMASLRAYIPTVLNRSKDTLALSHLLIPIVGHGHANALRRALRLVLSNWAAATSKNLKPDQIWDYIMMVEERILNENIAFYEYLMKTAQNDQGSPMLRDTIMDIAHLQLTKLYKYAYDESRFVAADDEAETKPATAAAE